MRRLIALSAAAALLLGLLVIPAAAQSVPPTPSRDRWYAANDTGHWSDGTRVRIDQSCLDEAVEDQVACSLEAFKAKPFTVIAFVDSGINPYHEDFRAPEFTHHPSTYLEGFPEAAESVPLSLDVADAEGYAAARDADDDLLGTLGRNRLYWFPGTRIIGGYSVAAGGTGTGFRDVPVLDENGHGTGVASVAAGQFYGSNPNALIVMVEGLGDPALDWATSQPWIDVVSNSWGPGLPGRVSTGSVTGTRTSTRRGQSVLFSSGNGMYNTNSSAVFPAGTDPCDCKIPTHNVSVLHHRSGPSWTITVGAASPVNGQAHWWHGIPADVASFGSKWRAAGATGVAREDNRDFGGTSCATPITAGVLSAIIETARTTFGDTTSGQRTRRAGVVAELREGGTKPATGPLADGVLTRVEAEEILKKTAQPVPFDAERFSWDYAVDPTTPAYYVQQGYGLVDAGSKARALAVLLGEAPMPVREDADRWFAGVNAARNAVHGQP